MSIKRLAAAAAVAAGLGMSATAVNAGLAGSAPLDPPSCPNWQKGCSGTPNPGYGGTGTVPPPGSNVPKPSAPPATTSAPWSSTPPSSSKQITTTPPTTSPSKQITTTPPTTSWTSTTPTSSPWSAPGPTSSSPFPVECPAWDKTCTPAPAPNPNPGYGGNGSPGPTSGAPWSGTPQQPPCPNWEKGCSTSPNPGPGYGGAGSTPPSPSQWNGGAQPTTTRPVLNAPNYQPPHEPYYPPRGPVLRGTIQIGGPVDVPYGFWVPGQGAPPPPVQRGYGWSDGPAPGAPPPNWEGPPPSGGWNGPPPAGGWNRPWSGPPVDASYGQNYFAPFTYNTYTVLPIFNWQYGGWGYWFEGVWIPLY